MRLNCPTYFVLLRLTVTVTSVIGIDIQGAFKDLGDFADIVAGFVDVLHECEYHCPEGFHQQRNSYHKPESNGCGSYGVEVRVEMLPDLTKCCNKHDRCYDTCGSVKTECDRELTKCVKDLCNKIQDKPLKLIADIDLQKACKSMAKVIHGSTAVLGCPAFLAAQEKACSCVPGNNKRFNKRKRDEM